MRRRVRLDLLLGVVVVLAVATVILVQQAPSSSGVVVSASPRAGAQTFAQSYLGYLDGTVPPGALVDGTAQVRSIAAGAPPIPAGDRQGSLRLTGVRVSWVRGAASAQAVVLDRDRANSYDFPIDLRYVQNAWQVVYLIPPDVTTIAARRQPTPAVPAAIKLAAERFALAYAGYRDGATHRPPSGLETIARQIAAGQDPLARAAKTGARPQPVSIAFGPVAGNVVAATAVLSEKNKRLRFDFDLERTGGAWHAWGFPEAGS